jgi:hypothetical protein
MTDNPQKSCIFASKKKRDMDYTKIPRHIIYKDRKDLDDFPVNSKFDHQFMEEAFLKLLESRPFIKESYEAPEMILNIFNNARYITTLICLENHPNHYFRKYLEEAGAVGRKAIVRMSKQADLDRRIMLAAMQMAREKGDNDFELLRKNRIKERQLLDRIYKKYNNMVRRDAKKAQQKLIKLSPRAFDMTKVVR